MTVDYEKGVIRALGHETPIIIDGDLTLDDVQAMAAKSAESYVEFNYPRFDIFVDDTFYNANQAFLDDLMTKFADRYDLLEEMTGWSSEQFYGQKLEIYVGNSSSGCISGWATLGEAHVGLSKFISNPAACNKEYFEGGVPLLGNPGELGDKWIYMSGLLHESLHAINPAPILSRSWLTEGFSEYYNFNVLSNYNGNGFTDINQETADYYLENANFTTTYGSFAEYVSNDYKDKLNLEIQSSQGYDIVGWMYSMMRDEHGLDWGQFFGILNANLETLDRSSELGPYVYELGPYFTDTYVIDVFGRASGLGFDSTQAIWRYDGPSGPGWGVRHWENRDWYPDLTTEMVGGGELMAGDSILVRGWVRNAGQTDALNVPVRVYQDGGVIYEDTVDVMAGEFPPPVFFRWVSSAVADSIHFAIVADEADTKIEFIEDNNSDSAMAVFNACTCPYQSDFDEDGFRTALDLSTMIDVLFAGHPDVQDALCPSPRADFDCDSFSTALDLSSLIDHLFAGGSAPCDPCD